MTTIRRQLQSASPTQGAPGPSRPSTLGIPLPPEVSAEALVPTAERFRRCVGATAAGPRFGGTSLASSPLFLSSDFKRRALFERLDDRWVTLRAGCVYETKVEWCGRTHTICFSVDEGIAARCLERGRHFDLTQGQWVNADGTRRALFRDTCGAWEMPLRHFGMWKEPPCGLENERVLVTRTRLESGARRPDGSLDFTVHIESYVSRYKLFDTIGRAECASDAEPVSGASSMSETSFVTRLIAPGIDVSTHDGVIPPAVAHSIEAVMGKAMKQWPARKAEHKRACLEVKEALGGYIQASTACDYPKVDSYLQRLKELVVLPPNPSLEETIWACVSAELELSGKFAQAEIVVVPKGQHWFDQPQVKYLDQESLPDKRTTLGFHGFANFGTAHEPMLRRFIFIPEGDVRSQRHELYHWLEECFFSPAERAVVDSSYEKAIAGFGAFAHAYGMQRQEYFATFGELFENQRGQAGKTFLMDEAPEVYDLISHLTGRR